MAGAPASLLGRAYLLAVPAAGVATLAWAVLDLAAHPPSPYWFGLTLLTAFTGSFTVKIPGMVARLSVSEPFVFAASLLFGPAAGTVTVAIDASVMSLRLMPSLRTPHRVLFNVGTLVLSVAASSFVFFALADANPRAPEYPSVDVFIWPLYAFSACCFFVNSSFVALALSIERGGSALAIWRAQFMWLSVNYFAGASVAALIVVFARTVDVAILGIIVPLVAISYLTFRTTLGRLDDANRHLGDLNALYLSTIETLAMAIDAKDQVTHGHIRRVQRYATGLARSLGITNDSQVRAIEAAALLHDMGKLAIPEFILNKPGKLTAREFSVMKTHAAVGADLLSSIQFPYPVIPIVRHHHENWDGTGYPAGLRGADIPIGARILAVVDCYDALTSHRPYRTAMTPEDALAILALRRGAMYDPLVVDAFIREHSRLRADAEPTDLPAALLANQAEPLDSSGIPHDIQGSPIAALSLLASLAPFPGGPSTSAVFRQIADSLRDVVPFDTVAVFRLNEVSSVIEPIFSDGSEASSIRYLRLPVAERLTGWVAAHRTAVWNSDASLDFALSSIHTRLTLASSLPLCIDDALVGVVTLYGTPADEISVGQRRALESLLPLLSAAIHSALQRPANAIDCGFEDIKRTALATLDSLLAHDRLQQSQRGILAVSIRPVIDGMPLDREAVIELSRQLSPATRSDRCVVVLAERHILLCSLDLSPTETLVQEVATAAATSPLRPFEILTTPIRTSLDLHDTVRYLHDSSTPRRHPSLGRVH